MSLTKLKLTDLETDREYLLLATKMNLTGVLVETTHTLRPGAPVKLSLQLEDGGAALETMGEVHKIAERAGGAKGMVIRFLHPTPGTLRRIETYISQASDVTGPAPAPPSRDRTVMVELDKLPKLSKPKGEKRPVAATVDEELAHLEHPGLGGETRILGAEEIEIYKRPHRHLLRKLLTLVVALLLISAIGYGLVRSLLRKSPPKAPVVSEPERAIPSPAAPDPKRDPTPAPVTSTVTPPRSESPPPDLEIPAHVLTRMGVSAQPAFLRIELEGGSEIANLSITRRSSPRSLLVDLPGISKLRVPAAIAVNKRPLLKIRAKRMTKGSRLTLELYPGAFPRYDVKKRSESVEIYLHR